MDINVTAASLLKAVADPGRLQLCRLLCEGAFNVSEITRILGVGQSTVSRNVRILVDVGLLSGRREGRLIFYAWRNDLEPSRAALQGWIQEHGPVLDSAARRRAGEVWEERRRRSALFFDALDPSSPSNPWLGSPDCMPRLLDLVPEQGVLLDLGTGTGRFLGALRERVASVVAVDASPAMLDEARRRMSATGVEDVDFRLGDIGHLPLSDGEVDTVVANMVLHHAPEPAQAVSEIYRVLRPGGTLLLGDFLPHDQEWMRETLADQWLGFSRSDISSWLDVAGFSRVTIESLPSTHEGAPSVFVARATRGERSPDSASAPSP